MEDFFLLKYFELIVDQHVGYWQFYSHLFWQGQFFEQKVKFARDWIACNRSNYPFMLQSHAGI